MSSSPKNSPHRFFPVGLLLSALVGVAAGAASDTAVAPTREWEWIIIHHSATRVGSAEVFDAAHRARGMINGLAYHFVIDNGTEGKPDGFIETGPRWIKQMHVLLIRGLQDQFHIPDDHVLGHGEVIGEFSECPGSQFPWDEFHKRLREAGVTGVPATAGGPARDAPTQTHHRP